jgi:hypothetical protein
MGSVTDSLESKALCDPYAPKSLRSKLILAFLLVSLVVIAVVIVFARWNTSTEFRQYVFARNQENFVSVLGRYYAQEGKVLGWCPASLPARAHALWHDATATDARGRNRLDRRRLQRTDRRARLPSRPAGHPKRGERSLTLF